jgi:nitrogen PTS system EIIA component
MVCYELEKPNRDLTLIPRKRAELKLSAFLRKASILTGLEATGPEDAIGRILQQIYITDPAPSFLPSAEEVMTALMEREAHQSTALSSGIAFPHARMKGIPGFLAGMGVSPAGIPFNCADHQPAHLIFLIVAPEDKPYLLLQAMAAFARFAKAEGNMGRILTSTPDEIWSMIDSNGFQVPHRILANDLMSPISVTFSPEMTIGDAARQMHFHMKSNIPVTDAEGTFLGFVTSDDLFRVGVPEFFKNLKTVSFIRELDPFENYFSSRHRVKVEEIMQSGAAIGEDSTLLEIVFLLSVKGFSKLYVVKDGKLQGVIDGYQIIDKVLLV